GLVWQGLHGNQAPIVVFETLQLPVHSAATRLKMHGEWNRIFHHFSAAAKGRAFWTSADIKSEFNGLRAGGGLDVELKMDSTLPNADKLEEQMQKNIDLVTSIFMDEAKQIIFEPMPQVDAAEAPSGGGVISDFFGGWGAGFALKERTDTSHLTLDFNEKID